MMTSLSPPRSVQILSRLFNPILFEDLLMSTVPAQPSTAKPERLFLSAPHMSGNEMEYVRQAFESNYIAPVGPQLNQFEAAFRETTGFEHCCAVSNGTSAIQLALRAIGVKRGDIVLGATFTFIGSVVAAVHLGAEVVFIDSDYETWTLDPYLVEQEIKSLIKEGRKPAAVLPTDMYGQSCNLDQLRSICDPLGIPVVCDSAEALGSTFKGQSVGRGAAAAAFSFNGNKIITTSGGGMIASHDGELVEYCRYLSTQAREPVLQYEHKECGYNFRMSNIIAAIGLAQLEVLPQRVARKRQITQWYQEGLADAKGIAFMPEADFGESNRWLTVIQVDEKKFGADRMQLIAALEEHNVESRPVWSPLHLQPAFAGSRCVGGDVSMDLFEHGVCLPSGTIMEQADVQRVCDLILAMPRS